MGASQQMQMAYRAIGGAPFNIGLDTIAATPDTWASDFAICYRAQASASGTLQTGFLYTNDLGISLAKVGIYGPDTDSAPNTEDALIGVSSVITGIGAAGWNSAAMSGGAIVSGQFYWVVIMVSSLSPTLAVRTQNATTVFYQGGSGYFASPPANLNASWLSGTFGDVSAYSSAL